MSSVTGMARLVGRSLPSVHVGNVSLVTEMNKARPFKFHPGSRTGGITRSQNRYLGIRATRFLL